ncbi:hypothetical protein DL96DRAFT_1639297 [Flagelloscypha sp. PMI_526]|nr:hypothetical protein DL96DRAFT_1639297 [Flagelloscypha sp. PMI_526]
MPAVSTVQFFPDNETIFYQNPSLKTNKAERSRDVVPARLALLQSMVSQPTRSPFLPDTEIKAMELSAESHLIEIQRTIRTFKLPDRNGTKRLAAWKEAETRAKTLKALLPTLKAKPFLNVPELPHDILWGIFTMSAVFGGIHQAKMLSTVSRQVCAWVDPYLFSGLNAGSHTDPHDKLLRAVSSSPRLQRVGEQLKLLSLRNFSPNDSLSFKDILSALPSVTAVAIIPPIFPSQWPVELLERVKRIQWHPRIGGRIQDLHPLYHTVTHLSLNFADHIDGLTPAAFQWAALNGLSALHILALDTAINIDFGGFRPSPVILVNKIQEYTSKFDNAPQLEVILWHHHMIDLTFIDFITDHRLLICDSMGLIQENRTELRPVLSLDKRPSAFWSLGVYDRGLNLLRARRANQLSGIKSSDDL